MTLTDSTEIAVKFSEVDQLQMVWHGHYIRYFEDGRESFGKQFKLSYLNMYKKGFIVPVVHANCDYKSSLRYGDIAIIETTFIPTQAAKIIFNYRIFNKTTGALVATGETIQVFLNAHKELQLNAPSFFEKWKSDNCID